MTVALPKAIELYFASENGHDFAATDTCFTTDATVYYEGRTMKGQHEAGPVIPLRCGDPSLKSPA